MFVKQAQLPAAGQVPVAAATRKYRLAKLAWEIAHAALWAFIAALLVDVWLHAALPCEAPIHFGGPGAARCLVAPVEFVA